MKMKTLWAIVLTLVSVSLSAFAGGEWVFTDPPITQTPDGSYVRNPDASIKGDWKQNRVLHGTPVKLPDQLPGMGSRETMLNYIVASNNMAMNVHIHLLIEQPSRFELSTGRWSDGYASYRDCLDDVRKGMKFVLDKFRTNDLPSQSVVYGRIYITYFNDNVTGEDRGNGLALSVYNEVSSFEDMTLDRIMGALEIDDEIAYGQVIVRVPRLDGINMQVQIQPGVVAELDWSASTGAKPSSLWRERSSREWTTPTYLYLRNWYADGSKSGRFTLRAHTGQVITYTEYGDNLGDVAMQMLHGGTAIRVFRPRGAAVDLASSPDLLNWTYQISVQLHSEPIDINVAQPLSNMQFFKGVAF